MFGVSDSGLTSNDTVQRVSVTNIEIPFGALVNLIFKTYVAALVAFGVFLLVFTPPVLLGGVFLMGLLPLR